MAYVKNKKTLLHIGSGTPATEDLAGAEAVATTSFECLIESMDGLELMRGTIDDPQVYCDDNTAIKQRDTDQLEVSNLVITGLVDDEAANGYDALIALANTMLVADTPGVLVITEPNGTDKLWCKMKLVSAAKMRGAPQDKQKFKIEMIAKTLPVDA